MSKKRERPSPIIEETQKTNAGIIEPRLEASNLKHERTALGSLGSFRRSALGGANSGSSLTWRAGEISARELPIRLYRFLKESIPVVSSCIWTWSRLSAAPAAYRLPDDIDPRVAKSAQRALDNMSQRLLPFSFRRTGGLCAFLPMMFDGLFTDGAFAGFVELSADRSQIARFAPIDVSSIHAISKRDGQVGLVMDSEGGMVDLSRPDFHYFALNTDPMTGLGRSILSSIPFVTYVERQLVDDMRRASHNSGFHRLHVTVRPPERQPGETDTDYTDRANEYFDSTARMIRQTGVDDNPVTWDDIKIEYIGPSQGRSSSNAESWFIKHRAMIEEICAGANLAPFLLGYSFGATETWSSFKYDLVRRQVETIQQEAARLMEWLGNLELALAGFDFSCTFAFDNRISHQATERSQIRSAEIDGLVKLFDAGLIEKDEASVVARRALS